MTPLEEKGFIAENGINLDRKKEGIGMKRKIEIEEFKIFFHVDHWRARTTVTSKIGLQENNTDELFSAGLSLPIENYNSYPEDIKKEVLPKLIKTLEDVAEELKKII